jgi:hypothetical protein
MSWDTHINNITAKANNGKSLMNTRKSIGPMTHPCGTPLATGF